MEQTHFGYQTIDAAEKSARVDQVFDSVATKYDCMNDLMSLGLHRAWKRFALSVAQPKAQERILDIASGTADLALAIKKRLGKHSDVWLTDINRAMLTHGQNKVLNAGFLGNFVQCDAENLPFQTQSFDLITVAFAVRNMTDKRQALSEMYRVLKTGGRLIVLEFSQIARPLSALYDKYSFAVIPKLGEWVTGDRQSYQYLVESIRMHPDQDAFAALMAESGFSQIRYHNLTMGVVAIHCAYKTDY